MNQLKKILFFATWTNIALGQVEILPKSNGIFSVLGPSENSSINTNGFGRIIPTLYINNQIPQFTSSSLGSVTALHINNATYNKSQQFKQTFGISVDNSGPSFTDLPNPGEIFDTYGGFILSRNKIDTIGSLSTTTGLSILSEAKKGTTTGLLVTSNGLEATATSYGGKIYSYHYANKTANNYGLFVQAQSFYGSGGTTGIYVTSASNSGQGTTYGIYSSVNSFGGNPYYAGNFNGNVYVSGTLSKSAGSFKIDHPQDPENMYLQHSFVESPDMMNIYNGHSISRKYETDANDSISNPYSFVSYDGTEQYWSYH